MGTVLSTRRSDAEQKRLERERHRSIERREPVDRARRERLEANPVEWLRYYKHELYTKPFANVHLQIVNNADAAMRDGTGSGVAASRGYGKTTLLSDMGLYGALSGKCLFPLVLGFTSEASTEMFNGWLSDLSENERLREDYPEICDPFWVTIQSIALKNLTWEGGEKIGCDVRKISHTIILPNGCVMKTAGINGAVRGLWAQVDGQRKRPEVVLLDDPQDDDTAKSPKRVQKIMEKIKGTLLSLSGPFTRIAIMAAVTVIEENDVAEQLLNWPDMQSIRCGQIETWPKDFHKKKSNVRQLWEKWNELRLEGVQTNDKGAAALAFYLEHKAKMTEEMAVTWEHKFDVKRNEPDAFYSAMWDYYRLGERAFWAERQNKPIRQNLTVYNLTESLIMNKQNELEPLQVPEWSRLIVAGTDINHYGLHTCVVAFGADQTAALIWWGLYDDITIPIHTPERERNRMIFQMLTNHGEQLIAMNVPIGVWGIDGGYSHGTVQQYVQSRKVLPQAVVMRGYSADKYRPWGKNLIGEPRENCHLTEWPLGKGLAWNADYWREIQQRAWLGPVGMPGSISVFAGNHRTLAEHITREKLTDKVKSSAGGFIWRWANLPGRNDLADALNMCYVLGAWNGIGTGSQAIRTKKKYVERRKAKVKRQPL